MQRIELLASSSGEPVAEHDAIEMVGLVLQAPGEQSGAHHLNVRTVLVLAAADRMIGPSQLNVGAWQGQTALIGGVELPLSAFRQTDFGVTHHAHMSYLVVIGAVVDEDCQINAHLGRSQTNTFRRVHGREHVAQQLEKLVIERSHRPRATMQDRATPADNRQHSAAGP